MPWYKFSCQHGPGHQSSSEEYFYSDIPMSREEKEDAWGAWSAGREHPVGKVAPARKLPEAARSERIEHYRSEIKGYRIGIKHCRAMLVRLGSK